MSTFDEGRAVRRAGEPAFSGARREANQRRRPVVVAFGGNASYPPTIKGRAEVCAAIDKDLTSAMLAAEIGADTLVMLTAVDRVALDFGKPTERSLDRLTLREARGHVADGQFPPGSMGPKITAALRYIESGGARAVITSLGRLSEALAGQADTSIVA